MLLTQARQLTREVEGWVLPNEGELLFELARRCTGRGAIVEIGSWQGRSTIWLGAGSRAGASVPVYAVDPHTGSEEHHAGGQAVWTFDSFRHNIERAGVSDLVRPIVTTSQAAAASFTEPVELLFIDGAHDYESVRMDLDLWLPRVVEGGIVAFHDTASWSNFPDVVRLVEERVYASNCFRNIGVVASITYAQKVSRNSAGERLRSRWVLWNRRLSGRDLGWVPAPLRRMARRLLPARPE